MLDSRWCFRNTVPLTARPNGAVAARAASRDLKSQDPYLPCFYQAFDFFTDIPHICSFLFWTLMCVRVCFDLVVWTIFIFFISRALRQKTTMYYYTLFKLIKVSERSIRPTVQLHQELQNLSTPHHCCSLVYTILMQLSIFQNN